ncbi:MAG: hypothetical protein ACRECH_12905 [Nitrososphaerales archaeon]
MDIRNSIRAISERFSGIAGFVTQEYYRATTAVQQEVARILTGVAENVIRPTLAEYVAGSYHLKDGTVLKGQAAFDRMVSEDKDVMAMIEQYRPSLLSYLNKARSKRNYINWDNHRFAENLAAFLEEKGISVDERSFSWLVRTCDRVRARIYDYD